MSKVKPILADLAAGKIPWGSVISDKMLTMHWTRKAGWSAPSMQSSNSITLSPAAVVFHYGLEIFEGLKAFHNPRGPPRLFRPQLNIARFNKSAERLALPVINPADMLNALRNFVYHQSEWVPDAPGTSFYVRPCMIGTDAKIGVSASDSATFFVIGAPTGSYFGKQSGKLGVRLLADTKYIRAWKGGVGYCKTGGNYALSILPAERARKAGFDQMMWLSDDKGRRCTEVGMMNVMFVYKDPLPRIVTPRLDGTILPGITRQSIIDLAPSLGVPVEQRDITIDEVMQAVQDGRIVEMFGTGTAAVICPIESITFDGLEVTVSKDRDVSGLLRKSLTDIFSSENPHPWMISAEPMNSETDDSSISHADGHF